MQKVLATTAAALASFTIATPVHAQGNIIETLLTRVTETGTTVAADDARICKDKTNLGMYEYEKDVIDQLTICVANHNGNDRELLDTILHESVHVAQVCKGEGAIHSLDSLLEYANAKEVHFVASQYSKEDFAIEMEARVIAAEMNPQVVINMLEKFCFE
jgi:hypothetical protein